MKVIPSLKYTDRHDWIRVEGEFAYMGITDFAQENDLADQIRYLGMITPGKELNALYNTATATILSSIYEGFSLAVIESISAGVPVIVDQSGPVHIGAGSICCDKENFVPMVGNLIKSKMNILCETARNNAVNKYAWDRIADDYMIAFTQKEKSV